MVNNAVLPYKETFVAQVEVETFDGPIKDRKCRDVIFIILFVALLGGMGYTTYLAFKYSNGTCLIFNNQNGCKSCPSNICLPKDINFSNLLKKIGMNEKDMVSDFKKTWEEICYMILLTIGVVLLICVLLRFFAGVIIWFIVVSVPIILSGLCVYTWITYNHYKQNPPGPFAKPGTFEKPDTWLYIAISLSVAVAIMLLIILVLCKRISLLVQLFKVAAQSLGNMPFLFLQPIWTFIIAIGCLAAFVYIFFQMQLAGVSKTADEKMKEVFKYLSWFHIFGSIWILYFVIACQEFVIASSVCMWYFTRDKKQLSLPILKSIYRLIRYHLGSLALGSFILALLTLLKLILQSIENRLKSGGGSVAAFMTKCCQCCLTCFEKILKFLNRNAYIEIAIHGYGFCKAARTAFMVIVNNALRVATINSVGDFVLFIAKIGSVAAAGGVGYLILKDDKEIKYLWLIILTICLIAYLIAACFFSVYEMVIDTLFICFCEDCDMNDGITKPFFMTKDLMKFVDKSKSA